MRSIAVDPAARPNRTVFTTLDGIPRLQPSSRADPQAERIGAVPAAFMLPNPGRGGLFPFDTPAWLLFFELLIKLVYALAIRRLRTRVLQSTVLICAVALVANVVFGPGHDPNVGFPSAARAVAAV